LNNLAQLTHLAQSTETACHASYRVGFEANLLAGRVEEQPEDASGRPGLPARHQVHRRLHSGLKMEHIGQSAIRYLVSQIAK
jgi:hypothetical protein